MPAYKDPKKNTWVVKYSYKDELDHKFHGVTKRGFATKREALAWEAESRKKIKGTLSMSFESFAKLYMEKQITRLKPSTYAMKESVIENHLIPYFGKMKVNEITVQNVMTWQNHLMGQKYTKSFLKTVHNQLNAILNFAVRYYQLPSNPAQIVGNMGTDKEVKINFWTKDQYLKFKECMMEEPLYFYAFECLYWLGIREGELLALTASDFDFEKKVVSITKTFYQLKGQDYITSPKTHKSVRKVSLPDFLCDELKDYMQLVYEPKEGCNRLFPITKSMLTRALQRGTQKAGLPKIRVHDLRHSHCSLLIEMGYSAVAIADRLGHESIHITYRYAHLFPSVQKNMAKDLNDLG